MKNLWRTCYERGFHSNMYTKWSTYVSIINKQFHTDVKDIEKCLFTGICWALMRYFWNKMNKILKLENVNSFWSIKMLDIPICCLSLRASHIVLKSCIESPGKSHNNQHSQSIQTCWYNIVKITQNSSSTEAIQKIFYFINI